MKYLNNVFSSGMIHFNMDLEVRVVDLDEFKEVAKDAISVVGHEDTARVLSGILERQVEFNRVSTRLESGDIVCVAQYDGPRLPLGATSLPEGAGFRWMIFRVR